MKVVLRDDVENLGNKGDLVEVADGYARNYLVPRGLALKASRGIEKQAGAMKRNREARNARERETAKALGRGVRGPHDHDQGPRRRRGQAVRIGDVGRRCRSGAQADRRRARPWKIALDEPLKELGGVELQVRLHPEVVANLHVEVEAAG